MMSEQIKTDIDKVCRWPVGAARENACSFPTCRCAEEYLARQRNEVHTMGTLIFRGDPSSGYELVLVEPGISIVRKLTPQHVGLLAVQTTDAASKLLDNALRNQETK